MARISTLTNGPGALPREAPVTSPKEHPRGPSMPVGSAARERWGHQVLGAVRAMCLADGMPGPSGDLAKELVELTYTEEQAELAIKRTVEAAKFDRTTAALHALRQTNRLAGRK